MKRLKQNLNIAREFKQKAEKITENSVLKPSNVILINHAIPSTSTFTPSKEALLIQNRIPYFPNNKALYGAIIKNPKNQYIYGDEIFDCIALGMLLKDKENQQHLFGAHMYISLIDFHIKNIIKELSHHQITPQSIFYSPRTDTLIHEEGLKELQKVSKNTTQILREKENEAEIIIGLEGIILNNQYYGWFG